MTREVPLSRGLVALVDDVDFHAVTSVGKWYANPCDRTFYARKNFQRGSRFVTVRMHTFLTGWDLVDHVNGNGLDNRRSNLRPATPTQNARNRGMRSDNTSGFKGVHPHRRSGRWAACIWFDGRSNYLGLFDDAAEAARVYDAAALEHFGPFARLNFPKENAA